MKAKTMPKERAPRKRGYLAKDDRHAALLKTAAAVVEKHGWPALSMISVAEHAKVSRQLVYEHFSSVDQLMTETMTEIFRELYETMRQNIRTSPGNIADLTRLAERMTFDQTPGRTRALWQMITATYSESPEAKRMSRRLRHLLMNLWAPATREAFDLPERDSRTLIWMLHMAFWGAHQLVDEGEITRPDAVRMFLWMLTQIQAGSVLGTRAGAKPAK